MLDTEIKIKKTVDAEWNRKYTLSPEAAKKLIADKMERARMYYEASAKQRERQALFAE